MPQLESLGAAATEPTHSGARAPQLERSPCIAMKSPRAAMRSPHATMKDPACRNKRSRVPQLRPNAAE